MLRPAKSYNLDALSRDELQHIANVVAFHPEDAVRQLFPDDPESRKHRIAPGLCTRLVVTPLALQHALFSN